MTKLAYFDRNIDVGIWSNLTGSLSIHADRTIYKSYTVRWSGNSGSLKPTRERITGARHEALLAAIKRAAEDEVAAGDYVWMAMDRAMDRHC